MQVKPLSNHNQGINQSKLCKENTPQLNNEPASLPHPQDGLNNQNYFQVKATNSSYPRDHSNTNYQMRKINDYTVGVHNQNSHNNVSSGNYSVVKNQIEEYPQGK